MAKKRQEQPLDMSIGRPPSDEEIRHFAARYEREMGQPVATAGITEEQLAVEALLVHRCRMAIFQAVGDPDMALNVMLNMLASTIAEYSPDQHDIIIKDMQEGLVRLTKQHVTTLQATKRQPENN